MSRRILIVGGAGAFGQRLVEGVLATTDAVVIVAGRTIHPENELIRDWRRRYGAERVETAILDRDAALAELHLISPLCVVDAAGPFQGTEPHLARAAIAVGCHYIDLADARDFVMAFSALDAAARDAGILAVTGASSTPALSGVAVSALTQTWQRIDEIEIAISPGNRAPRGLSVVKAILTYAGQPIRVWKNHRWIVRPGWSGLVRQEMPGLGRRWLSLCETPDLDLLPTRYPSARTVMFRAGLELPILHLGLWLLALPVRWKLMRSLYPLAALMHRIAGWFERFGTDRGGMIVTARGKDRAGHAITAIWSLVAEAGDGPNIPVLPALAMLRRLIAGDIAEGGAKVSSDLLSLDMIEREFARFRISTRQAARWPDAPSLPERALGPDAEKLPSTIRSVHGQTSICLRGRATIKGAGSFATRLIAGLFGFPPSDREEAAAVVLKQHGNKEIWIRRFGNSTFRSTLQAGTLPRRLSERFGLITFELEMTPHASGFDLAVVGWRIGWLRLPSWLAPKSPARAFVDEAGRYRFDVSITLPFLGQLVHYSGWLEPEGR